MSREKTIELLEEAMDQNTPCCIQCSYKDSLIKQALAELQPEKIVPVSTQLKEKRMASRPESQAISKL